MYIVKHNDSKGTCYPATEDGLNHVWQPFKDKAQQYTLNEVLEIAALIQSLNVDESLTFIRVS